MKLTELTTPCYIINDAEFVSNIEEYKTQFGKRWADNVILGFSLKTNNFPYMLKRACENGMYAEIVSPDEYELAERCGCARERTIYNGPQKHCCI